MGAVAPHGGSAGTTVEVHQLFGNVPARRAFLRSPQTEWSHASEAFVRTALAHPDVAFSLAHNGRRVHDLPATDSWRRRIGDLFGAALAERLIEVDAADGDVSVRGFVGRPEDDVAGTRLQHLFVRGRPFRDRSILHAVQEAYRGLLLTGRQPIVFLRFELPADAVDVNVHPAKMEVRFREPSRLYRLVLAALRTRFLAADATATRLVPPAAPASWSEPADSPAPPVLFPTPAGGGGVGAAAAPAWRPVTAIPAAPPPRAAWEMPAAGPVSPVGADGEELAVQMHDRYIVVESADGIEVIDQHALHERILYERFKAAVA
jgi:DNA mismatch repair protein MutL